MSTKIKTKEWLEFKTKVLDMLDTLVIESDKIFIPESPDEFDIHIDNCIVHPVFVKKPEFLKVEYDMTLCDIEIRTLSFYLYPNLVRFDFSLKNPTKQICQESQY